MGGVGRVIAGAFGVVAGLILFPGVAIAGVIGGVVGYFGQDIIYGALQLFDPDIPTLGDSPTYRSNAIRDTLKEGVVVPLVYGTCKVGGNIIRNDDTSETTYSMYLGVAQGEVHSFGTIKINNVDETDLTGYYETTSTVVLKPTTDYIWIESGSGTSEYYCTNRSYTDPGFDDPSGYDDFQFFYGGPDYGYKDEGSVGSLSAGEWAFDDNDSLGYDTFYFRTPDSANIRYDITTHPIKIVYKTLAYDLDKYYGTRVQTADARFAASACAYRGLAYLAFTFVKDEQLGACPNITTVLSGKRCIPIGGGYLVLSGTYQWTASGHGTNEYYCEADGGGDPSLTEPDSVHLNGLYAATATIGSLSAGTWVWGDNDSLGYDTVYVRLSDGADPDSKDDGYVRQYNFSRNPAVILYDFLVNVEGYSFSDLSTTDFQTLETYCDVDCDGTPRYRFDFAFDTDTSINDAKKLIWNSFHGLTIRSQGTIKPVWDKSKDSSHAFTEDNIVKDSFSWGQVEKYNVVRIHYIDSDDDYKKSVVEVKDRQDIDSNGEHVLEQQCFFITDRELAERRAKFLFDKYKYSDYTCRLTGFPDSQDLEVLDRATVTHTLAGWTTKDFLVTSKSEDEFGRPTFDMIAYYAGIYNDEGAGAQQGYLTELPNPRDVPDSCSNLSLSEDGYINKDGSYVPTLTITYDLPNNHIFWSHAEIHVRPHTSSSYEYYGNDFTNGQGFVIDGSKAKFNVGHTVYVKVVSVNELGIRGVLDTSPQTTETIDSQLTAPDPPHGLHLKNANRMSPYVWDGNQFTIEWVASSLTGGWGREEFGQELSNFGGAGQDPYWQYDILEIWVSGTRRHKKATKITEWTYVYGDTRDTHLDNYIVSANGSVTLKLKRCTVFNKQSEYASLDITHASPSIATPTVDFTGRDCVVDWEPTNDPALKEYMVQVYSDSDRLNLLRTEYMQNSNYVYTYEKNDSDNSGTPIRTVYFTVTVYNVFNQTDSANCYGANSAPSTPSAPSVTAAFSKLKITWTAVTDIDIIGYNVYCDTNANPTTLVAFIDGTAFTYEGDPNTLYYAKVAAVDAVGEGTASSATSGTTTTLGLSSYTLDVPLTSGIDWSTDSRAEWTEGTLVYEGTTYTITAGNTTDAYIYWNKDDTPTTFHTDSSRPTLGDDIYLMAYYDSTNDDVYPAKQSKIYHGGIIQANSITANEISVTNLSSINADLGTITAGTVTGATIQTASSGQRIVMSHSDNTLRGYDASAEFLTIDDDLQSDNTPGILLTDGIYMCLKDSASLSGYGDTTCYASAWSTDDEESTMIGYYHSMYNDVSTNTSGLGNMTGVLLDTVIRVEAAKTYKANAYGVNIDIDHKTDAGDTGDLQGNIAGIYSAVELAGDNFTGTAYGVYSYIIDTDSSKIPYSGWFEGGDFIVRLGDAAGARKIKIQDSAGSNRLTVDSDGDATFILGDAAGVNKVAVQDSGTNEMVSINSDGKIATKQVWVTSNTEDLTANKTLTTSDAQIQFFTSDNDYDVNLPAEENSDGLFFIIRNNDPTFDLTIKNDGGIAKVVISPQEGAVMACDGTNWEGFMGAET